MTDYERWYERLRKQREATLINGLKEARRELEELRDRVNASIRGLSLMMDLAGIDYEED